MTENNPFKDVPKNSYCTIYIVRHGQTDWNIIHRVQGITDLPLNENGKNQASLISKEFKDIKFNAIFSSDLTRAKQTAEIIAAEHNLTVVSKKTLREKNYGKLEGHQQSEMVKVFNKYEKLSKDEILHYKIADGAETDEEVISRYITFLREAAIAYMDKNIIIVSHGALIRILLIHLGIGEYKNFPPGSIENTATIKILSDGIDFFIEEMKGVRIKK